MTSEVRIFRIEAAVGAAEVFQALRSVCEDPSRRGDAPSFEFDWMKRRVALAADSREGLAACADRLLGRLRELGAGEKALLPGAVERRDDGRFVQPFGVTLQEPALFARLIGQALLELGLQNVRATESDGVCRVSVPSGGLIARRLDIDSLLAEFPVPEYIHVAREE